MDINYDALLNELMLASICKENATVGKALTVFTKRGIPITDAMAILLEISDIMRENGDENT